MHDIPLEGENDGYDQGFDIMVLPISLAQFWEAYLANDAPYYYIAYETKKDRPHHVLAIDDWGEPSDGATEIWKKKVIEERMFERWRRLRHNIFTTSIHEEIYLSLVEHDEKKIVLKETTIYPNWLVYRGFE